MDLDGVHYFLWYVAALWDFLVQQRGFSGGTITGGREPAAHPRYGTEHRDGLALDFRTRDLPTWLVRQLVDELRQALGPSVDVIIESDHVHVDLHRGTRRD